jgi:NAD(P)H-dependent FMN reductase
MKNIVKNSSAVALLTLTSIIANCSEKPKQENISKDAHAATAQATKMSLAIILGSTREGRSSDKIATQVKKIADKRTDFIAEIIDLRDHRLPFLDDAVAPIAREKITDPIVQKWSEVIGSAQAFIFVVPEYNSGYPGVLKNALDSLYKEWNNKPAALIGYSGGPSGGSSALNQLKTVLSALKMTSVEPGIKIPQIWNAFDDLGNFKDKNIEAELNVMLDKLAAYSDLKN